MKAVVIKEAGGEAAVKEREKPEPGPVLTGVHTRGVFHSDLLVREGASSRSPSTQ